MPLGIDINKESNTRRCTACDLRLHASEFYKTTYRKGVMGLRSVCKKCYKGYYSIKKKKEKERQEETN